MADESKKPELHSTGNAAQEVMTLIGILTSFSMPLKIAEIGVGDGSTALPAVLSLSKEDSYYMFDFNTSVSSVKAVMQKRLALMKEPPQIFAFGNSNKTYDSYNWSLCKFMLEVANCQPFFDLIFLDGSHLLIHDLGATAVLKELVKKDGYIIFDDVEWTVAVSPTCNPQKNPQILNQLTEEQIKTPAIKLINQVLMDTDERYAKIKLKCGSKYRAVYKRIK